MPILIALAALLFIALIFGPQLWVQHALKTHGVQRPDLPGTGGELARHLLDEAGLDDVRVESTEIGDHYDPEMRVVRLLPQHLSGKSIAAVAIAAHEVSHAVQHARAEPGFMRRMIVVERILWIDRIGMVVLLSAPLLLLVLKTPLLLGLQLAAGFALMSVRILAHLVTLPIEFDASFGKALPVLERGGYVSPADMPAARTVLKAAAWTYVAAALATLLDVARWFRIIRF
ncbi:MAG: zinc metallopeptidase [Bosea sp. (in: a-proteobacteria)]